MCIVREGRVLKREHPLDALFGLLPPAFEQLVYCDVDAVQQCHKLTEVSLDEAFKLFSRGCGNFVETTLAMDIPFREETLNQRYFGFKRDVEGKFTSKGPRCAGQWIPSIEYGEYQEHALTSEYGSSHRPDTLLH